MEIRVSVVERPLTQSFGVSHTRMEHVHVVALRLTDAGGAEGTGEVGVGPWAEESPGVVANDACELAAALAEGAGAAATVDDVDAAVGAARERGCPATACLLAEMAFLDLVAREAAQPLWRLLDLPEPADVELWQTVAVGDAPRASRTARYKVKLGGPDDRWVLQQLAGREAEIIVDVNGGWDRKSWNCAREALGAVSLLALEDPVGVDLDEGAGLELLAEVRACAGDVPIVLDESVRRLDQIERVAGVADGANVKLTKFGGLLEARRAIDRLGALGLRRMLGCFLEPPRAIAYAAQLASLVDWADLDGHLWLAGEQFERDVLRLEREAPGVPSIVSLAPSA
jgi:L-alanine-DL-glutamate epimerase-like enolase superfamily enzyme